METCIQEEPKYLINLDFNPLNNNLVRTFHSLAEIIQGEEKFSNIISQAYDKYLKAKLILDNLETGSIRTFVCNVLKNAHDEDIKDKGWIAIFNSFLIESKKEIITLLNKTEKVDKVHIPLVRSLILAQAEKANIQNIITLESISEQEIIECIDSLVYPQTSLDKDQKVTRVYNGSEYTLRRDIVFNKIRIQESLQIKSTQSADLILEIKKPDYMGESKWTVYHQGHKVEAKILDLEWLRKFQEGELPYNETPMPKDALRVEANVVVIKDNHGREVDVQYEVIKIKGVIKNFSEHSEFEFEPQE